MENVNENSNTQSNYVEIKDQKLSYEVNEEMKVLRTNLQFSNAETKVILMTSCVGCEGKSTTSMNLALSLCKINKTVILVDADLRKSVMEKKVVNGYNFSKLGLSHYLSGQASLSAVLRPTNYPNLNIVMAGDVIPPNPSELLSSPLMKKMIDLFRQNVDYIIVDAPPLGLVIDAAIIAENCDAAVIVMESGSIKYRFAQSVKTKLEASGCKILGVVLNKVDYKKGKYYGDYYGRYYEKYYGHNTEPVKKRGKKKSSAKAAK